MLLNLVLIALKLEGLLKNAATHAAGLVIGDKPLLDMIPLYKDPKSKIASTQYNMKYTDCLLYTSPSPRDRQKSRMPSSA